jgi:hypothetical protein
MRTILNRMGLVASTMVLAVGVAMSGCEKKAEPAKTAATTPAPTTTPAAGEAKPAMPNDAIHGGAKMPNDAVHGGAAAGAAGATAAKASGKKTFTFAVIAKSQSNPVFIAAKNGAMAAGRELSKDGITVNVQWLTPAAEDAQKQAEFITQAVNSGVDGIAVSVTDAKVLTSAWRPTAWMTLMRARSLRVRW